MEESITANRPADISFCRLENLGDSGTTSNCEEHLKTISQLLGDDPELEVLHELNQDSLLSGERSHQCSGIVQVNFKEGESRSKIQKYHPQMIQMITRVLARAGFFPIQCSESFASSYLYKFEYPSPPLDLLKESSKLVKFFARQWNLLIRKTRETTKEVLEEACQYAQCKDQFLRQLPNKPERKAAQNIKEEVEAALANIEDDPMIYGTRLRVKDKVNTAGDRAAKLVEKLPDPDPLMKPKTSDMIWALIQIRELAQLNHIRSDNLYKAWKGDKKDIVLHQDQLLTITCSGIRGSAIDIVIEKFESPGFIPDSISNIMTFITFDLYQEIQDIVDRAHITKKIKAISHASNILEPIFPEHPTWKLLQEYGTAEEQKFFELYLQLQQRLGEETSRLELKPGSETSNRIYEGYTEVIEIRNEINQAINRYEQGERSTSKIGEAKLIRTMGTEREMSALAKLEKEWSKYQGQGRLSSRESVELMNHVRIVNNVLGTIQKERQHHETAVENLNRQLITDEDQEYIRTHGTAEENEDLDRALRFQREVESTTRISQESKLNQAVVLLEKLGKVPDHIQEELETCKFLKQQAGFILERLKTREGKYDEAEAFFRSFQDTEKTREPIDSLTEGILWLQKVHGITNSGTGKNMIDSHIETTMANAQRAYMGLVSALPYHIEGSSEFLDREYTVCSLLSMIKADIQIHEGNGTKSEVLDDDKFHLHIWASPEHELPIENYPLPDRVLNYETKAEKPLCMPSNEGRLLRDKESGIPVAQAIGKNLYVLMSPETFGTACWEFFLMHLIINASMQGPEVPVSALPEKLKTQINKTPAEPKEETDVLRRELNESLQKTETLERELLGEGQEIRLERFRREYDKIISHPKVTNISIGEKTIVVTTKTLFCRDSRTNNIHEIGRFKIYIPTHLDTKKLIKLQIKWKNLDRTINNNPHKMYAPHIEANGIACLGNTASEFKKLLQTQQYYPLMTLAIRFVESANVGDVWGNKVSCWPLARSGRGGSRWPIIDREEVTGP